MTSRRLAAFALALALALPLGCTDPVDKAAKARIFSPEEPAKEKLAAAQPIDTTRLSASPELAYRVISMGALEAFERLGPHKYAATASFQWGLGKDVVKLSEERTLSQDGLQEYALKTENDHQQGLEIVRLGARTFVRSRFSKFRERTRDREQSEKVRDDVFAALRTADTLCDNRLNLAPAGDETVSGRSASKYLFVLAPQTLHSTAMEGANLPPLQFPTSGPDVSTRRRIDFSTKRKPQSVEGYLWVDTATGVPLKVDLTAKVVAPGEAGAEAELTLTVKSLISSVGTKAGIEVPKDALPDEDRPAAIAAALERFEVARAVDGGTPAPPVKPKEEPEPETGE